MNLNGLRFGIPRTQCNSPKRTVGKAAFVIALLLCPLVETLGGFTDKEKAASSRIQSLGGKVIPGQDDRVEGVILWEKKATVYLTDDEVESIDFSVFSQLKILTVHSRDITDRSLVHLGKTPSELTIVRFILTKMTDKGLTRFLGGQKSLQSLGFQSTPITDESMTSIGKMESLRMLSFSGVKITDIGVQKISDLKELRFLELERAKITDAALKDIVKLKNLMSLNLYGTRITDKGILQLADLPKLRRLCILHTDVTDEGKEALQQLMPNLEFFR